MAKQKFSAATTFIILACLFAGISQASPWDTELPITMGHRGTPLLEDENTMPAYESAMRHGVHVIECDPRLTADGVYVIMHDDTVDRTTNGTGSIYEMTLDEVMQLRTESGHQVPTLEQVLVFARDNGMSVYLDIKSPPADGARQLVGLIEQTGMTERVIAGCWHKQTLKMIEAQNPEISTCISWPWPALTMGQAKKLGADAIGTLTQFASKLNIRLAHSKGLYVISMPINSAQDLKKHKARGMDGLQSDDPRLLEPYGKQSRGNSKAQARVFIDGVRARKRFPIY